MRSPLRGVFREFVNLVGKRGKALLHVVLELLVKYDPETQHEPSAMPSDNTLGQIRRW